MRTFERLPCGSLRDHEPHQWTGQSYGETLRCPGASGGRYLRAIDPELSRRADRRLREENTGITDSWSEDA